ncbi:DUF222 domain-containing protein [Pseudarthrobacter sp. J1738]|uniref:HNH endonuclease signature motif containing protein n=1 Tax=Pseudarthrobacter sp. J1738 TaxID=3420446 RepID=UPI003D2C0988
MERFSALSAESLDAYRVLMSSVRALGFPQNGAGTRADSLVDVAAPSAGTIAFPVADAVDSVGEAVRGRVDAALDALTSVARVEAQVAALKVRLLQDITDATDVLLAPEASPQDRAVSQMSMVAEVACALTVSETVAGTLILESRQLSTELPFTLRSLQLGEISWAHARILCNEVQGLERGTAAGLEAHFLDPDAMNPARGCPPGELVPARFRAKVKAWRERHHPASITIRHVKGVADRRLEFTPDRDGMAWLSAYLPADKASAIWNRATQAGRALQNPKEPRTLTQLRADTATTWLLGGTDNNGNNTSKNNTIEDGAGEGFTSPRAQIQAQVLVTVPVLSLMGVTEEPAVLDGYGPIPPAMARELVAEGAETFHRVLIDPVNGAPLEIGRSSYRVPKAMRQWLRMRDGKCPFPGCNNSSLDNDADHILSWASGGTTGISNLGQPCKKHHRLKHSSTWQPTIATKHEPPGWISPHGKNYPSETQNWETPWLPPDWADELADVALEQHAQNWEHAQLREQEKRSKQWELALASLLTR